MNEFIPLLFRNRFEIVSIRDDKTAGVKHLGERAEARTRLQKFGGQQFRKKKTSVVS